MIDLQYEKAAEILSQNDPPVVLAKVDANEEQNKALASEFDIKGFPTLKILRYGGSVVQDYKGPREADGIVSYVKKQSGPASAEIKSSKDAEDFIDVNKIIIVSSPSFLFPSHYICIHIHKSICSYQGNLMHEQPLSFTLICVCFSRVVFP